MVAFKLWNLLLSTATTLASREALAAAMGIRRVRILALCWRADAGPASLRAFVLVAAFGFADAVGMQCLGSQFFDGTQPETSANGVLGLELV
jgi:hypothetical protein